MIIKVVLQLALLLVGFWIVIQSGGEYKPWPGIAVMAIGLILLVWTSIPRL